MALHVSTVVVPIDFSIASAGAIETALEIVDNPSQLHLIHVMLLLETMSPGVLLGDITDVCSPNGAWSVRVTHKLDDETRHFGKRKFLSQ